MWYNKFTKVGEKMEEKSVLIDSPFITLGQLLKEEGLFLLAEQLNGF